MPLFCSVFKCGRRGGRDKGARFFRLPAVIKHQGEKTQELSERRRREWLAALHRDDIKPESYPYTRVCDRHFVSGEPSKLYDSTNPDWVPSRNLGHEDCCLVSTSEQSLDRYTRAANRAAKRLFAELAELELEEEQQFEEDEQDVDVDVDIPVPDQAPSATELLAAAEDEIRELKCKLAAAEQKIHQLTLERQCLEQVWDNKLTMMKKEYTFHEEAFHDNDTKVSFYTGLPTWEMLQVLYTFIKPCLLEHSSLTQFQQLVMALMRLRLNLTGQDLGYRFGVHKSTISRLFSHALEAMFVKMKPLIIWPDRDILRQSMPMDFRKFCPSCVVIIDCFEVFLERPTNVMARAQTFSSYKHHNTVKYLIGITPQGTVCFISEGWGGRVSDKHLTENCGILDHLMHGDTILADRGFDIQDSVSLYCARITMPAFTKGKKQLSGVEVEQSRRIANVRIHVERVIGCIRQKYMILSGTLPIDFVTSDDDHATPVTLDKVVCVSCALVNMCDSVVPFD